MNDRETAYVDKFRELLRLRERVKESVSHLTGLCASLKDWAAVAATIGKPGEHPAWSVERLNGLVRLRDQLRDYEGHRLATQSAWDRLKADERFALPDPATATERDN